MKTMTQMVYEFHETYGAMISNTPVLPDTNTRKLRIDLLKEELDEFINGEAANNIVEIADALGDIMYVAIGAAISYGIPIDAVFSEIHRSNMSKLGADGKPIYREDGKVLKGPNYTKPDVARIIREHGGNV